MQIMVTICIVVATSLSSSHYCKYYYMVDFMTWALDFWENTTF